GRATGGRVSGSSGGPRGHCRRGEPCESVVALPRRRLLSLVGAQSWHCEGRWRRALGIVKLECLRKLEEQASGKCWAGLGCLLELVTVTGARTTLIHSACLRDTSITCNLNHRNSSFTIRTQLPATP